MDREKVIEHLQYCVDYLDGNRASNWVFVRGDVVRAAFQLLKAQEQKRGRWTTERTSDHDGEWYCSACGYDPIVMTDDMKFCPGCGAKMTMEGKENAPE